VIIVAICFICEKEVDIKTTDTDDGNEKFLNAVKFEIKPKVYDRIAWHDYCCAFAMLALMMQKNAADPKARALGIEGLRRMKEGAQKIKLVPKEFLYV